MIRIIFLASFFALMSCSFYVKRSDRDSSSGEENVVDINESLRSTKSIQIKENPLNPLDLDLAQSVKDQNHRNPVIGLFLGPGVYRSGAYIGFIRKLEESGIPVHLIAGRGWGSIVAAIYASNGSAGKTEWTFFRLISELKREKSILSKSWNVRVRRFLKKHFGTTRIQDTKKPLVFAKLNSEQGRMNIINRGSLIPHLLRESWIDSNVFRVLERETKRSIFYESIIKKLGADIIITLGSLGEKINFNNGSGILVGLFSKLQSDVHREKESLSFFVELKCDEFPLDSWQELANIVRCGYKEGEDAKSSIQEKISEWKSEHNKR